MRAAVDGEAELAVRFAAGEPDSVGDAYRASGRLVCAVAYRVLGSAADAEDAVQDAWVKWSSADRSQVADPKAYLVRIVTNVAMDRLRSASRQRETYVGPWLPEPILTSPDVAEDVLQAESVSLAMLVVLETLSPIGSSQSNSSAVNSRPRPTS